MFTVESCIKTGTKSGTKIVPSMKAHCTKYGTTEFEATLLQQRDYFGWASFSEENGQVEDKKGVILTVRVKWRCWDGTARAPGCGHRFSRAASKPLETPCGACLNYSHEKTPSGYQKR